MSGLLSFLTILGAALAGFFGLDIWSVPAFGGALFLMSTIRHRSLYARACDLGIVGRGEAISTAAGSLFNGLMAASLAYGFGFLMQAAEHATH